MEVVLLAFVAMLMIVAAMAVGVMFGRQPIKGTCGGIGALGLGDCEICGGDPARCETRQAPPDAKHGPGAFYEVSGRR